MKRGTQKILKWGIAGAVIWYFYNQHQQAQAAALAAQAAIATAPKSGQ